MRIRSSAAGAAVLGVASGQPGKDGARQLSRVAKRALDDRERDDVLEAIATADFWNLPTQDLQQRGSDGSEWLLEARNAEHYHVVQRWSPVPGPFRDACLVFARLGRAHVR